MLLSVTVLTAVGQAIREVHTTLTQIPTTTGTQTTLTLLIIPTLTIHGAITHGTQEIHGIQEAPTITAGQAVTAGRAEAKPTPTAAVNGDPFNNL